MLDLILTKVVGDRIRFAAEPVGGLTSLTDPPTGPGFGIRDDL